MRRIAAEQRGSAMVAVMGVLLVTAILSFAVAASADRTNEGGVRDTSAKRALAAADAGLNIARHRVGETFGATDVETNDASCFPVVPAGQSCQWSDFESLGNGTRFRYWVSPVMTASNGVTCVDPVVPPTPANARQRCITAIGESGEIERRLQTRIVEYRGAPIFPFPGMLGLQGVTLNQSDAVGTVGSNVNVNIGPGSSIEDPGNIMLPPGATVTGSNYEGDVLPLPAPFVADNFDDWYSESRRVNISGTLPAGNYTLPGGTLTGTRHANPPNGNGTITLTPGRDYNFCSITFNSSETFVVPSTATEPVRIFVDAPPRPDTNANIANYTPDGCTTPAKAIDAASGSGFVNNTGKSSMLQVYVYSGAVEFHASAEFVGTLWAPQSDVVFNSGARLRGAIVARTIRYNNNGQVPGFVGDPDADTVTGRWDGAYTRNGWRECRPSAAVC